MKTTLAAELFGALFAIMNPTTNLPVLLTATQNMRAADQRKVGAKTAFYRLFLGGTLAEIGSQGLGLFGISVDDLRVACGLIIAIIGLNLPNGNKSSSHHRINGEQQSWSAPETVAFYTLTFPILVVPGTITSMTLNVHHIKAQRLMHFVQTLSASCRSRIVFPRHFVKM